MRRALPMPERLTGDGWRMAVTHAALTAASVASGRLDALIGHAAAERLASA